MRMKKHKIIIPMVIALLALIIALALILSRCNAQPDETLYGSTPSSVPTGSTSSSTGAEVPGSSVPATTVPISTPAISIPSSAPTVPSTAPTQSTGPTQPTTTPTTPTTVPATVPTQPAKPNGCSHTFTEWEYEEYTFTHSSGGTYTSHRKYRTCTKCGYKETDGTADHICQKGSDNHVVTTVKEGTCSTKAIRRSTCNICGWYVEYEGSKGKCNWVDKEVHLSDYGAYTNELDATVSECTSCGDRSVVYHKGEGWSDYNRYRFNLTVNQGNATNAQTPVTDDFGYYNNPQQQTVKRDFVYDADGYVKQFTVYWWYNGSRYSQVIHCGEGELEAWFAEYGLTGGAGYKHSIKISGNQIVPWKVSWTG